MTVKKRVFDETAPRIVDIETGDPFYYDPDLKDHCVQFCNERDIDCLPALDDKMTIYARDELAQDFKVEKIKQEQKVNAETGIFDPELLEKFRKQHVLMVYHAHELTGVVHFSDYDKPVVSSYLYKFFFDYEKALRELLIQEHYNNHDMIAYFEKKVGKERKPEKINYLKRS